MRIASNANLSRGFLSIVSSDMYLTSVCNCQDQACTRMDAQCMNLMPTTIYLPLIIVANNSKASL